MIRIVRTRTLARLREQAAQGPACYVTPAGGA